MTELISLVIGMIGKNISAEALAKLLPTLIEVGIDLADGDTRLTPESRLKLQEKFQALKEGGLL